MKKIIALSILAFGAVAALAQTNSAPSLTQTAALPDLIHLLAISVVVPMVIAGVKKISPNLPSNWLPILAPLIGGLGDYLLQQSGVFASANPAFGFAAGLMGIGLREVFDQHKDIFVKEK